LSQAILVSSPSVSSSPNCAASLASAFDPGRSPSPSENEDLVETFVQEALLVARQAPFGHDRAAARDDAGNPLRSQRNVFQPHAGVNGEVVDALLGLLDQRVLEHFPIQLGRVAVDLLQRLVDRHGTDRYR